MKSLFDGGFRHLRWPDQTAACDIDGANVLLFDGHPGRPEPFITFGQAGDGGRLGSLPDRFFSRLEPTGNGDDGVTPSKYHYRR